LTVAVVASLVAIAATACGGQAKKNAGPAQSTVASAFKGSPPALAALHAQANELLGGGKAAFQARLAALKGHPVVVNKWASWCGPCQSEFPMFQQAAVTYGKRVAFLGLDGKDTSANASSFLRNFPVTYPSYEDPNESIANSIQAATYFPLTEFFDRSGRRTFTHAGAYASLAALETDIKRYALK
jgi:thiol-disulfide isomerase/thioredoxin